MPKRRGTRIAAALLLMLATLVVPATGADASAPPALRGATLTAATYGLRLAWDAPAAGVTSVVIRAVYDTSTPIERPSDGDLVATLPASRRTYTDVTVVPGHTRHYALFARSSSGYGPLVRLAGRVLPAAAATQFQVVYVVPRDVVAVNRTAAIRTDLGSVIRWFAGQTGGRRLRFVRAPSHAIRVQTFRLSITRAALQRTANGHDGLADIKRQLGSSGLLAPRSLAVVYVESSSSRGECGVEGGPLAVLWMHSCGGIYPSTKDAFPYGATYLAAHEMTHAMGAAPNCARHSTKDGHVGDSWYPATVGGRTVRLGRDIIYEGPPGVPWGRDYQHLVLDWRHDDYYGTGSTTCPDLAKDRVWIP
ncbi:MAG: hypothetical protein ACTHMS_12935 [Jatrophihabitans sp.]|uniref:hypothetical protein n=1 Tax=Jatrophihabitans sp. TaxID=1932789 RepID=UPI003F81533B